MQPVPSSGASAATWADFICLPEGDSRELIDGALIEVDVPTELHEHIVTALAAHLYFWAKAHGAGPVLASGYRVKVSETRGVMPDLQLYRRGNTARRTPEGLVGGHPDLVVEVVSPTSRRYDRVTKLEYYTAIGVPEYWIVDPEARTLERLSLRDGAYTIVQSLAEDAVFAPAGFDGLAIPLAELWSLEVEE